MSSTLFLCNICQDNHAIANLRSLPCGHVNCETCLTSYMAAARPDRKGQYLCPHCRALFKASQRHPLFLESGDSATQTGSRSGESVCHSGPFHCQVASALREVTRMEEDLKLQVVQRAAQEMAKVTELMSSRDCLLSLLTAVAARWRGMLPLFSTIAQQRIEIASLQSQLQKSKEETAQAERVAEEAVKASEKTLPTLKRTQSELREAKIRLDQLERETTLRATTHKAELASKNQEVGRLHDRLRDLKAKEARQKEQIKRLEREAEEQAHRFHQAASQRGFSASQSHLELEVLPPESHQEEFENLHVPEFTRSTLRKRGRSADEDELISGSSDSEPGSRLCAGPPSSLARQDSPAPKRALPPRKKALFTSEWQVDRPGSSSRALQRSVSSTNSPALKFDRQGNLVGAVQTGPQMRVKYRSPTS